ncbi:MAG: aminotransferase class I/II-fold pyridoxal phosphate-dependent enzyme [Thermomicrobiales bacterium]
MDQSSFLRLFEQSMAGMEDSSRRWESFEPDPTTIVGDSTAAGVLDELVERLQIDYPYGHPRYAGQMLKPPHPIAILAYATTMFLNPNNHALDGGAATSQMEKEVIPQLAAMFGYPETHLGHLTSSGTIANLEALWIARCINPDKAIAVSDQAHYTHARAGELLRTEIRSIPSDANGKIDIQVLEEMLERGDIGTVVATAGTTGLGAVDPIHEIRRLTSDAGVRLHVDAAYGGFFSLLARSDKPTIDPEPFLAISEADSVVVDPHKHGLQPYGCGAVIFRDAGVGQFYQHDSPYTYFTSDQLHLGEISLECSRAGASAAALWATLKCLPLEPDDGLGRIVRRTREAGLRWAELLRNHPRFRLTVEPDLDIVSFYAVPSDGDATASAVSALTRSIFDGTENDPDEPAFLATLRVNQQQIEASHPEIVWDQPTVEVLRQAGKKPEHAD